MAQGQTSQVWEVVEVNSNRHFAMKLLLPEKAKKRGKTAGTPSYMSPEQIRNQPLDVRADIYSFGASAYEIATGRTPFRGVSTQNLLEKHFIEKPSPLTIYHPDVTNEFSDLVL